MERDKISREDKWDLTLLFENDEECINLLKESEQDLEKIERMHGIILKNKDTLKEFLAVLERFEQNLDKICLYSHLKLDSDSRLVESQKLDALVTNCFYDINEKLAFIDSEILSHDKQYVLNLLDGELNKYKFYFEQLFRSKEHTLSEKEEEIIAASCSALGAGSEIYYNLLTTDAKFKEINFKGEKYELNESNYVKLLRDKRQDFREAVFNTYYDFFINHKNTIAACYINEIKSTSYFSKVRKYPSSLESSLYEDNIDKKVYTNLIESIHKEIPLLQSYLKLKQKALGLKSYHMYDIYLDYEIKSKEYDFDSAKKIILKVCSVFGDDYINKLNRIFDENWIDKYACTGKKSGGYQSSCYNTPSYILLNYNNDLESVFTLIHELGHAVHSLYSSETQDFIYHNYSIFLAEIASTVNEVLLFEYLYKNSKDKEEKISLLIKLLDMYRTTIFRQTMFAEFESNCFDKNDKGEPLTEDLLSKEYYTLNKEYYGDSVISDELIRYEWMRIPHFYTPFYVYKYATGLVSALSIVSDIQDSKPKALEKYINLLKSGSSDYPVNLLKQAGVDIQTNEPYEKAFNKFREKLNELEELLNEN